MPSHSAITYLRRVWELARIRPPRDCIDPEHYRRSVVHLRRTASSLLAWKLRAIWSRKRLVLIVLDERLGDIMACEPIIAAVRRRHPDDLVIWLVRPAYACLLRDHPGLDGLLEIYCLGEWIYLMRLPFFDIAYDLNINRRLCLCGIPLRKRHGNPEIVFENYYERGPLLQAFAEAAALDLSPSERSATPWLRPTPLPEALRRKLPEGPFVAIHARSDDPARNWNPEGWRSLIEHAWREHALPTVEIGTSSELGLPKGDTYTDLTGACSILETAEIIRRSSLFVGIDSGPAHLANAVGTLGNYQRWKTYTPYTGRYADEGYCTLLRHREGPVNGLPITDCLDAFDAMIRGRLALRPATGRAVSAAPSSPITARRSEEEEPS
jgi:heptosyltransferase-3